MAEPAILVDGLTRDFGQVRAVDRVSFEVATGSIFGFLGPNGAGKTTTINLLLGLLSPTSGSAAVLGFDTAKQPDEVRAHTGALLDDDGIYGQLTVEENLEFYGRVWRLPPQEMRTRTKELLNHYDSIRRPGRRADLCRSRHRRSHPRQSWGSHHR